MTKIVGAWIDPGAPPEFRGRVVIRDTKHGPVAQSWPRKRTAPPSVARQWLEEQFKIAQAMTANAMANDAVTARFMAEGTEQVPRDILTMAAYGTYYIIELEDGTVSTTSDKSYPGP